MGLLRTEGFAKLLERIAEEADTLDSAYAAALHTATLGGRLQTEVGLGALSRTESLVLAEAREHRARRHLTLMPGTVGERMALTGTGRLRILTDGEPAPVGALEIGRIDWGGRRPADLDRRLDLLRREEEAELATVHDWLRARPGTVADTLVGDLRTTLDHVGPMRVYIGPHCYTNLGREHGNLIGKSVSADSDKCRLNGISGVAVEHWTSHDAAFVVCMSALIASGTPSRTEEFSGTQLTAERLETFIRAKIASYDGEVDPSVGELPLVDRLFVLAAQAKELRPRKLERGPQIYRTVQAMTINKQERFLDRPVTAADLPAAFAARVAELLPLADLSRPDGLVDAWSESMPALHSPASGGFTTGLEEVIHDLVQAGTEATGSHVGMSRGPRDITALARLVALRSTEPGHWKTSDYYCCVVPGQDFTRRFDQAPQELPQVIRAIAARMRWNGWHFMPHASGVSDDPSFEGRDWFYAPTMPDMTEWTSHHHQGHVANGVRHAIRVPLGLTLAGAHRPGLHDFRLMRTDGEVYGIPELRAAIAIGQVLQSLYQAHARRSERARSGPVVSDFGNTWYQQRYAPAAAAL
ncbi:hypothetical protein ABZO31_26665 [Streptomyces sp. HUAS MG47]|uniref:hypothetical protein n=1 Tax=Streptomyces solicamelliae TaxID=3231716 RepID=UPI0038782F5F